MKIEANVLGDEYDFFVQNDSARGSYEIVSSTIKDEIPRYGDIVTISAVPINDKNSFGYYDFNGVKIFENEPLTVEIKGTTVIKVQFYNEFENKIIYNPNGGEFVGKPIEKLYYTTGNFENLDHCYNKMKRDGHSLIGLQEGTDGEIHALGGMVKIPEIDLEMFAVWKKWTEADCFKFFLNAENKYLVDGLSAKGIATNLTEIVIPESYNNVDVVGVAKNAFRGNNVIKSVYFNKNIALVEDNAFNSCENLENIMIFETMTEKSANAFSNCPKFATCEINAVSNPDNHNSGYDSLALQWCRLKDRERGKRVITFSGSSGPYGMNSELFIDGMNGLAPLVMGYHAGIGMKFLLDLSMKYLVEGDIAIIAAEYEKSTYGLDEGRHQLHYFIIQQNYDMVRELPILENMELFTSLNEYFINKNSGGIFKPIINGFHLDQYGAIDDFRDSLNNPPDKIYLDTQLIQEKNMNIFNNFAFNVNKNGVKTYFSFPSVEKKAFQFSVSLDETQKEFTKLLKDELMFPIISKISDYEYESKFMCETSYHLSTEGAKIRTSQLVKDIKAQLAKEGIAI